MALRLFYSGAMWLIPLIAVAIAYWLVSSRLRRLEDRSTYDGELTNLSWRVGRLEEAVHGLRKPIPSVADSTNDTPAVSRAAVPAPPSRPTEPEPISPVETPDATYAPVASFTDRVRGWISRDDWEALVGGNILNKIGALLLVIGIALFCGYTFHHVGPAARAGGALAVSIAVLASGVWLERRAVYQTFGRGLIGAGWAALYATTYAIYALPAARLIESGFVGSILQLVVAALMILHSLRYRSQTVTSLAYFAAFVALAVTPSSQFAVLTLVPLAVALLYLAHRFQWHRIALFGLIATYSTCAWRESTGASIWSIQFLFILYWTVFEGFDLLRVRSRRTGEGLEWIFPLNAIGFLGLSYGAWAAMRSDELWIMAAVAAVLYASSAAVRLTIRPPASFGSANLLTRLEQGSFEGPCALAAAMSGMAIVAKVPGVWKSLGLAVQAELLYWAGVRFRIAFLQRIGLVGFVFSLISTSLHDVVRPGRTVILGHPVVNWTPSAVLHAAIFYLNRLLQKNAQAFSFAASILLMLIVGVESPSGYSGFSWMCLGGVLFELGWRKHLQEFRFQGAGIAALGAGAIVWQHGPALSGPPAHPVWISLLAGGVIAWSFAIRILLDRHRSALSPESSPMRDVAAGVGSLLFLMSAVVLLPGEMVTPAWFVMGCACLALGWTSRTPSFRWLAQGILLCAFCRCATVDLANERYWYLPIWAVAALVFQVLGTQRKSVEFRVLSHWIALFALFTGLTQSNNEAATAKLAVLGTIAVFHALQFLTSAHEPADQTWFARIERHARVLFSTYGTVLLTAFLWAQVSGKVLTMALGLEGLSLLAIGFPLRDRALRLPGLALLLGCVCKLFLYDLRNLESVYRTLSFIALGAILVGVSWIYTRFRDRLRRYL